MKALALLLCTLCLFFSGCTPTLPGFAPFETEAYTEAVSAEEAQPSLPPTVSFDGRRFSFDGDPNALHAENDLLIIQKGGCYRICGILYDGGLAIRVDAEETVELILDGVSLTSLRRPCLTVLSAGTVILRTEQNSTNVFKTETEAVIRTKGAMVLCGAGTLSLRGPGSALVADAALTVQSGSWMMTAGEYGISGLSVGIFGGNIAVNGTKVGVFSTNSSKDAQNILISGGSLSVLAIEVALATAGELCVTGGEGSLDAPKLYEANKISLLGGEFPAYP